MTDIERIARITSTDAQTVRLMLQQDRVYELTNIIIHRNRECVKGYFSLLRSIFEGGELW